MAQARGGDRPGHDLLRRGARHRHRLGRSRRDRRADAGVPDGGTERKGYCALGSVKTQHRSPGRGGGGHGPDQDGARAAPQDASPDPPFHGAEPEARPRQHALLRQRGARRAWPHARGSRGAPASARSELAGPTPTSSSRRRRRASPGADARRSSCIVLSARTAPALDRATERLRAHLAARTDIRSPTWRTRCRSAGAGSSTGGRSWPRAARRRSRSSRPSNRGRVTSETQDSQRAPVAFLFPGPGSAMREHGPGPVRVRAGVPAEVDECAEILRPQLGIDLRTILYPSEPRMRPPRRTSSPRRRSPSRRLFVIELRARAALGALGHRARRHDRPQPRRVRGGVPRGRLHPRRRPGAGRRAARD